MLRDMNLCEKSLVCNPILVVKGKLISKPNVCFKDRTIEDLHVEVESSSQYKGQSQESVCLYDLYTHTHIYIYRHALIEYTNVHMYVFIRIGVTVTEILNLADERKREREFYNNISYTKR
jgi:hypothetical protein